MRFALGVTGMPDNQLGAIHEEILELLVQREASYARPLSSAELGLLLRVAPSYIREQASLLRRYKLVSVRRGRGGGYYLSRSNLVRQKVATAPSQAPRAVAGPKESRERLSNSAQAPGGAGALLPPVRG